MINQSPGKFFSVEPLMSNKFLRCSSIVLIFALLSGVFPSQSSAQRGAGKNLKNDELKLDLLIQGGTVI
ncbi:MAG: hypothetical protein M3R11_06190, partial [Acidobacteriota bacterium]|nr:hypothetical protein [Acidobacteriota bacterium]